MKIISGERASGKTSKIVDWFIENYESKLLLVPNNDRREQIKQVVNNYFNFPIFTKKKIYSHIVTFNEFRENSFRGKGTRDYEVGVDGFLDFLNFLFPFTNIKDFVLVENENPIEFMFLTTLLMRRD